MSMTGNIYTSAPEAGSHLSSSKQSNAREWRVGSLSMGITLMLIGTAFAVSLWQDADAYDLLLWVAPVVFILLGLELLIYLGVAGKGERLVRYDWISVFFVGVIGLASLVLALLMSTGLFEEIKREINTTHRTAFVTTENIEVPKTIQNIIVQSSVGISVEQKKTQELHLMGQVDYRAEKASAIHSESMLRTEIVGSDMYVFIGKPEWENGSSVSHTRSELILTIPEGVTVERRSF